MNKIGILECKSSKISRCATYLILIVEAIVFGGCKGGVDQTLEAKVEETYLLGAKGTLSIRNEDGSIRLYGADSREVYVEARKRAYSKKRLDAIQVRGSVRNEELAIETIFPPKKKWSVSDRSGTVDYIVIIPQHLKKIELDLVNGEISIDGLRGGNARTSVVNGRTNARNCFANLDYKAKNGAIDFYYNWWEPGRYLIKAEVPNGAVGIFLPRSASFRVDAETQGGSIMGNLIDENEEARGHRKTVRAMIGSDASTSFQLRSVNANIRIHGY
jgi:hypothetical protein